MIFGALVGAGASLLGSAMGGGSGGTSFKFRPMDATIQGLGSATMDKKGGLNVTGTAFDQGARGFFQDQFGLAAGDPMGLQNFGANTVLNAQSMFNPAFQASMAAGFDPTQAALAQYGGQNQAMQNLFGGIGGMGMGAAFGAPTAGAQTGLAMQQAQNLFGQTDLSQLAADRTAQLNALAAPAEQAATNQKLTSLFGSGRLGTSGGLEEARDLAMQQTMAATQRGLAGMDFAEQQRQANLANAQGLLGQAMQGVGLDQARAMQLGQFGMGAYGQMPGLQQGLFENQFALNNAQVSRADQRLQNVQQLFGFGSQLFEQPTAMAARTLQGTAPIDQRLMGLGDMSIRASNAASGQSTSGGNPMGNALMGMGGGLFNAGIDKFFGNNNNSGGTSDV